MSALSRSSVKSKRNIVLLGTDSRESHSKAKHYAEAARELGLAVRTHPDQRTIGVFPCSDHSAGETASLCRLHGIPGPDPIAVAIASNKSHAYHFLASEGFRVLYWHTPVCEDDLAGDFDRPIIVKPECGSGSFARHDWGYRTFRNVSAFRRYLEARRLKRAFFTHQENPYSGSGRYIFMEYVDARDLYIVAAVVGDRNLAVCLRGSARIMPGPKVLDRILVGKPHRDADSIVEMITAFAKAGLRRTVVYVQCVERGGRLYPIDINLRPGTMWELAADALGLRLYTRMLGFMLGLEDRFRFKWPAPYVGIRRMNLPLSDGRRKVRFGPGCIPLISKLSYDPEKPYDLGHAWPMFAVLCDRPEQFDSRARAVIKAARITTLG